jgi:hypothetical protein
MQSITLTKRAKSVDIMEKIYELNQIYELIAY